MSFTLTNIANGYADVTPSIIPNTNMRAKLNADNSIRSFWISPCEGFVVHDNAADYTDIDGNIVRTYSSGTCSCGATYDFSTTQLTVPDINGNNVIVTAYGSREFFAFPENLVPNPEMNIYGGGNNAEVMSAEEETEAE